MFLKIKGNQLSVSNYRGQVYFSTKLDFVSNKIDGDILLKEECWYKFKAIGTEGLVDVVLKLRPDLTFTVKGEGVYVHDAEIEWLDPNLEIKNRLELINRFGNQMYDYKMRYLGETRGDLPSSKFFRNNFSKESIIFGEDVYKFPMVVNLRVNGFSFESKYGKVIIDLPSQAMLRNLLLKNNRIDLPKLTKIKGDYNYPYWMIRDKGALISVVYSSKEDDKYRYFLGLGGILDFKKGSVRFMSESFKNNKRTLTTSYRDVKGIFEERELVEKLDGKTILLEEFLNNINKD